MALSCEKHIMALASTKTGTYLSSSSGPSGPRVTVLFFFADNTAAGACQRPDNLARRIVRIVSNRDLRNNIYIKN